MNTSLWSDDAPPRLLASCHRTTGEVVFPPMSVHSPLAEQYEVHLLDTVGTLYSLTIIHPSVKSGLQPFVLGYLDTAGPARLFGRINGARRPVIGDQCRIVPHDVYGYEFELVEAAI